LTKLKDVQILGNNNIPKANVSVGYIDEYFGKILNKDGSLLFYSNFQIESDNNYIRDIILLYLVFDTGQIVI